VGAFLFVLSIALSALICFFARFEWPALRFSYLSERLCVYGYGKDSRCLRLSVRCVLYVAYVMSDTPVVCPSWSDAMVAVTKRWVTLCTTVRIKWPRVRQMLECLCVIRLSVLIRLKFEWLVVRLALVERSALSVWLSIKLSVLNAQFVKSEWLTCVLL
jgi:hypothetical protein